MCFNVNTMNEQRLAKMINPLPKNKSFPTLREWEVRLIIAELPEEHRHAAWQLYHGTLNLCSVMIDEIYEACGLNEKGN